jgi:hypothetical protein
VAVSAGGTRVALGSRVAEGVAVGSGMSDAVGEGCAVQAARKITIRMKAGRGRALATGNPFCYAVI